MFVGDVRPQTSIKFIMTDHLVVRQDELEFPSSRWIMSKSKSLPITSFEAIGAYFAPKVSSHFFDRPIGAFTLPHNATPTLPLQTRNSG